MSHLQQISIRNFRNIESLDIVPCSYINVILGPNGAGKSSFLEALGVLSLGKSFRTHKFRNLIKHGAGNFTVFGRLSSAWRKQLPIGIERFRNGNSRIRVDDKNIVSSAALARNLPLMIISADSFKLIEGSPKDRRKFLDWLVFHVKHEFASLWKEVSHCIKQRNILLRSGKIDYSEYRPWDREISRLSGEIDLLRFECIEKLKESLVALLNCDYGNTKITRAISLEYDNGWAENSPYDQQLEARFERDIKYGYTTLGPHKADIKIKCGTYFAGEVLSRGQLKSLITSLYLAEAQVFIALTGASPVIAIDDYPSELDESNQLSLGKSLLEMKSQVFITGITEDFVGKTWNNLDQKCLQVFHVKHGELSTNENNPK